MSYILFKKCWVGNYVGEGTYEGGPLPDILISNVPNNHYDIDSLFNIYLYLSCDGFNDQGKKDYKVKFLNNKPSTKVLFKNITDRSQLVDYNNEEYIEIDYVDLIKWYSCEVEDEVESILDSNELLDRIKKLMSFEFKDTTILERIEDVELIFHPSDSCIEIVLVLDDNSQVDLYLDSDEFTEEQVDYLLGKNIKDIRSTDNHYDFSDEY